VSWRELGRCSRWFATYPACRDQRHSQRIVPSGLRLQNTLVRTKSNWEWQVIRFKTGSRSISKRCQPSHQPPVNGRESDGAIFPVPLIPEGTLSSALLPCPLSNCCESSTSWWCPHLRTSIHYAGSACTDGISDQLRLVGWRRVGSSR